jgi:hypothetical protein
MRATLLFFVVLIAATTRGVAVADAGGESASYKVSIEGFLPCGECSIPWKLRLRVLDKATGEVRQAELETGIKEAPEETLVTRIVGARVLVIGKGLQGVAAAIIDVAPHIRVVAAIKSYHLVLSPTGSTIIFESWRVRDQEETQTAILSLLDVIDPAATRVVFPPENVATQTSTPWEPDPERQHAITSPISWRRDGKKVVFVDSLGTRGRYFLVEVDVSRDGAAPVVWSRAIETAYLLDPVVVARSGGGLVPQLVVETIDWVGDARVALSFVYEEYWRCLRLAVFLPSLSGPKRGTAEKGDATEKGDVEPSRTSWWRPLWLKA